MEKKIIEILQEIVRKTEGLLLIEDCEDEGWYGKCLLYCNSKAIPIPENISHCYLGRDYCYVRLQTGKELELEYDDIEIWKLPLNFYEIIDFVETVKEVPEVEKEKLIRCKIQGIKNEISGLEYEIRRLESLLS